MSQFMLNITDFGAKPETLCTQAIQTAIDQVGEAGGGTVLIPDGTWISGTLMLRSGTTLHINPNAVLKGSDNLDDYPPFERLKNVFDGQVGVRGEVMADGMQKTERHHFIVAENVQNIVITGGGTIDGSGPAFWEPEGNPWIPALPRRVSPMLEFRHVKNLTLDNIRIDDSPGWTIHPYCCDHVIIRGLTVENNLFGPNTDGIDVNGCRDVFISDCKLTCGDDCIIIKATRDARSTERVLVTNCVCTTNCIGVGIGQECESGIRQVTVSNCVMHHCHRMFTIGIWAGGTVEDVTVTGCVGDTLETFPLARPLQLEVKQHMGWDVPLGILRNVQISNILCRTEGRILFTAQDGAWLENIVLRDINLIYTDLEDPIQLSPPTGDQGSSQYANRNLEARKQPAAMVIENAKNFVLDGLYIQWPQQPRDASLPHAALWARHIKGGMFNAPMAQASDAATDRLILDDADLKCM